MNEWKDILLNVAESMENRLHSRIHNLETKFDKHNDKTSNNFQRILIEINTLKVKATMWGLIAGGASSILISVVVFLIEKKLQ